MNPPSTVVSDRSDVSILPRGPTAWAIYAMIALILVLSSAAPFVRFGSGVPRLGGDDAGAVLLYLLTWIPLLAIWIGYVRMTRSGELGSIRRAAAWAGHCLMLVAFPALHTVTFLLVQTTLQGRVATLAELIGGMQFPVLMMLATLQYLVMVAVLYAVLAGRASNRTRLHSAQLQVEQARLQEQLAQARVQALTAQLHPHFLFNTLNAISVLTGTDPAAARVMVRRLSDLLRAMLADRNDVMTPLRREIALLESYLEIHRIRLGDRLRVRMVLDPRAADSTVPALLLQPLVENALEHAVTHREDGGEIEISTWIEADRLRVTVRDDGPGRDPGDRAEPTGGIGLSNTRERLRQIYGANHTFSIARDPRGGCVVSIDLPAGPP